MSKRGTMKLYFTDATGTSFNLSFTNAELETPASDIRLAAATIADSVIAAASGQDLEFVQATGMVESVLAEAE